MIITCTSCSMRLQVEDEKVPARPFTLRCPKCHNMVQAQPPAGAYEKTALGKGDSPSTDHPRLEAAAAPAASSKPGARVARNAASDETEPTSAQSKDLLRVLTELLQRGTQADRPLHGRRHSRGAPRVLICVGDEHQEGVLGELAKGDYQVFVAKDKSQAVERMRDERMDVVILSTDFDPMEQGSVFIGREISSLRPAERRRMFLVQLTDSGRTLDSHAAFVNNVSLIVNTTDIQKMAHALERSLLDYNELYRNFNEALKVDAI